MDLIAILVSLWTSLSHSLGGDALALAFTAGFAAVMVALWLGLAAFRKTEFYKQHQAVWDLVDGRIADLVWLVEVGDVDLTEYEKKADERAAAGMEFVDPRMLYLLDKVQVWVKEKLGVDLDFDEVLARAEHIFDEVKNSDGNSVGSY